MISKSEEHKRKIAEGVRQAALKRKNEQSNSK